MPTKSLHSSVIKWPDRDQVDQGVRAWVADTLKDRDDVLAIGYFGSYARGDWGVGSDLDLIMIVDRTDVPFERRSVRWDLTRLPVQASLLVYTLGEWKRLQSDGGRFARTIDREAVWVLHRAQGNST